MFEWRCSEVVKQGSNNTFLQCLIGLSILFWMCFLNKLLLYSSASLSPLSLNLHACERLATKERKKRSLLEIRWVFLWKCCMKFQAVCIFSCYLQRLRLSIFAWIKPLPQRVTVSRKYRCASHRHLDRSPPRGHTHAHTHARTHASLSSSRIELGLKK